MVEITFSAVGDMSSDMLCSLAEESGIFEVFGEGERLRIDNIRNENSKILALGGILSLYELTSRRGETGRELEIIREAGAKPRFSGEDSCDFNISHSGSLACAALCLCSGSAVGIDIECLSRVRDLEATSRRFFTELELEAFFESGCSAREFYRLWCLKEARAKATGEGLAALLASGGELGADLDGHCFLLKLGGEEYMLAVAVSAGEEIRIIYERGDIDIYGIQN